MCTFTWYQQLRPPSTLWTTEGHSVPSLYPHQGKQRKSSPHWAVCQWLTFSKTPHIRKGHSQWRFPHSKAQWLSMAWKACTQKIMTVRSPDTLHPNNWPHSQTSNPFKKRYPQNQNWWMSQKQMTYQTTSSSWRRTLLRLWIFGIECAQISIVKIIWIWLINTPMSEIFITHWLTLHIYMNIVYFSTHNYCIF